MYSKFVLNVGKWVITVTQNTHYNTTRSFYKSKLSQIMVKITNNGKNVGRKLDVSADVSI